MDENMNYGQDAVVETPKFSKTWTFSEKINKHQVHHTLSVEGNRLTHISEVNEVRQQKKERSDIKLSNVRAVHSYYGLSRNILAVIIMAILAFVSFVGAVATFAEGDEDTIAVGIVFLLIAGGLGFLAYWFFKRIKPAFVLEIEMVERANRVFAEKFAYGSSGISFSKKKLDPITLLIMVVIFPIGLVYLIKNFKGGNKYKFIMDPETGHEIVDTLGEYLIGD